VPWRLMLGDDCRSYVIGAVEQSEYRARACSTILNATELARLISEKQKHLPSELKAGLEAFCPLSKPQGRPASFIGAIAPLEDSNWHSNLISGVKAEQVLVWGSGVRGRSLA